MPATRDANTHGGAFGGALGIGIACGWHDLVAPRARPQAHMAFVRSCKKARMRDKAYKGLNRAYKGLKTAWDSMRTQCRLCVNLPACLPACLSVCLVVCLSPPCAILQILFVGK